MLTKSAKLGTPDGQVQAQIEPVIDKKDISKDREKDNSHPLSQENLIEDWLAHFDQFYRKKSGIANYRYSRKDAKIRDAIEKLVETGATFEQVEFVFNDIWDDKDAFWQEHKGKIWVVESQFATRVAKMNQSAQKRRTASGFTNWTEDKSTGVVPEAARPAQDKQLTYTRLETPNKRHR